MIFQLGELFCGPGGGALGAFRPNFHHGDEPWSISHQWASDNDQDTCETYRNNLTPDVPDTVICEDVRQLDIEGLRTINAFAFGFPCNDFSIVGETNGLDGNFGPLYTYGVEVLNHFNPLFFVAENVGGIRGANNGNAFVQIMHDLENAGMGYILHPHQYCFSDYGVPQNRNRIVIVGIRTDQDTGFQIPAPITTDNPVTAGHAIEGINGANFPQVVIDGLEQDPIGVEIANHDFTNHPQQVIERLNHIQPGQNAWNSNLPERLQLNVPNVRLSHIYRKLVHDKPAYTVTGNGGGGTHMYHWDEPRALTNRERARLQSFPDDFVFHGRNGSVRSQIGMAIPPLGAQVIFEAVLQSFAGIEYPSVAANIDLVEDFPNIPLVA